MLVLLALLLTLLLLLLLLLLLTFLSMLCLSLLRWSTRLFCAFERVACRIHGSCVEHNAEPSHSPVAVDGSRRVLIDVLRGCVNLIASAWTRVCLHV